MVRFAEWREAHDPARPFRRLDGSQRILLSIGAAACGLACCGVGAVPAFVLVWDYVGGRQLMQRVQRLRDDPADPPQIACRLTLAINGFAYGRDEGLVTFTPEALLYEGRQTSFAIPHLHASPTTHSGTLSFPFDTPVGTCTATIESVEPKAFNATRNAWTASQRQEEAVLTIMPPVAAQPFAYRYLHRMRQGAWIVAALGIGACLALVCSGQFALGIVAAFAFAPACAALERKAERGRSELSRLERALSSSASAAKRRR